MGAKAGSFQLSIGLQASELATTSIGDKDPEGIPRLKQQPFVPGHTGHLSRPQSHRAIPETAEKWGIPGPPCGLLTRE